VGKVSKAKKKKKKKPGGGRGEKKVAKKKLRSGLRKGKPKKSTWVGTWIEKRILSVHHPSTLVHWWVLVHSGPALDAYFIFNNHRFLVFEKNQTQRTIASAISKPSKNC
jgi:hypothetical protein